MHGLPIEAQMTTRHAFRVLVTAAVLCVSALPAATATASDAPQAAPTPVNARLLAPGTAATASAAPAASVPFTPPVERRLDLGGEPRGRFALPSEGPRHMPAPASTRPAKQRDDRVTEAAPSAGASRTRSSDARIAKIDTADHDAAGPLASATIPAEVPSFFIGRFPIPPFLLPIYLAAADRYGVPWEVLAAINEIETDYGRDLRVSTAGATGWMQLLPASWRRYGLDADADGASDPYDPADAIFTAARYLRAAGAAADLRKALFAYDHADWYVDTVLARARFIAGLPSALVDAVTGLGQGDAPIAATMSFAHRVPRSHARSALRIDARAGAPVVAVQDGTIMRIGRNSRLGRFVVLRDIHGDTYTYAHVARLATNVLVPTRAASETAVLAASAPPPRDPAPRTAASAGSHSRRPAGGSRSPAARMASPLLRTAAPSKERLFAHPARRRSLSSGGRRQILDAALTLAPAASLRAYFAGVVGLRRQQLELRRIYAGRHVLAGTILGRVGASSAGGSPHILFSIRPPGIAAPRIDPEPFVEGWHLGHSSRSAAALAPQPSSAVQAAGLRPSQWSALVDRLARITDPAVSRSPRRRQRAPAPRHG
jgi:murein DD-endopeptidase MepM/ murein hydrolase activator NlpD